MVFPFKGLGFYVSAIKQNCTLAQIGYDANNLKRGNDHAVIPPSAGSQALLAV
jgi:hypothetical protein